MSADLVAFLHARWDEQADEAPDVHTASCMAVESSGALYAVSSESCTCGWPARVLADIDSKREILDRYEDCLARLEDPEESTPAAASQIREYDDFVLPGLAAPFSGHPDWREEWQA